MNRTKCLGKKIGFVLGAALLGALTGHTAYAAEVSVSVTIHAESDFYEPLTPYGEWVVVGSYGRCWRPARVEVGWRPYCNGSWQRTDAGWYWVSDEPWGWATYHYGRWDIDAEFGWFWVPQTVWAPAWVSWHEGGGYIGWAPLSPSGRVDVRVISPRAFVFVEERRFLEPIRPTTVVVNNTTIINNTVINEAPRTDVIEKVSGHKIQAVQVSELRHKEEAAVVVKQQVKPETKRAATPEAVQPSKPEAKPEPAQPSRPEAKPQVVQPNQKEAKPQLVQPNQPEAKPQAERPSKPETVQLSKPEPGSEAKPNSKHEGQPAAKPEGDKQGQKQEKPDNGSEKKGEGQPTP